MNSEMTAAMIGGLLGGVLGVLGTLISSYYGPRKMEEWREQRREQREHGPRKQLLKKMLEDKSFPQGCRYLETLCLVTGTSPEECRRLLIEIEARGVVLPKGEGWALISRKPLAEQ